jgi:hypothetical protein
MADDDAVLAALDDLTVALRENIARNERALRRADEIRAKRAEGLAYREIVESAQRPLIVELIAANMAVLADAGSRLRRAEARALHDEGLTMERIATLFGVTRQRISELLRTRG